MDEKTDFWAEWSDGLADRIRRIEEIRKTYVWYPTEAPREPAGVNPIADFRLDLGIGWE